MSINILSIIRYVMTGDVDAVNDIGTVVFKCIEEPVNIQIITFSYAY